jgi:hypothetical protein
LAETYYVIRVIDEVIIFEFDSLEEVMEVYRDGDIVAKKIPVAFIPEK